MPRQSKFKIFKKMKFKLTMKTDLIQNKKPNYSMNDAKIQNGYQSINLQCTIPMCPCSFNTTGALCCIASG